MRMRLPRFSATCPHVRDQIITVNGVRLNLDHLYRVLRARAQLLATAVDRSALSQPRNAVSPIT